jgi:hypothetical protein
MAYQDKAKKRARDRAWYWRHRDRLTEERHKRQEENYEEYKAQKRERDKTWRQRHRDRLLEKRRKRQEEIKTWYRQYKTKIRCIRCGENDPACLQFHHRNRDEKKINIATYVFQAANLEKFIQELNKCDVLCANCHWREHWQERDESADTFEYTELQQQLLETQGWRARLKIKRRIYQLDGVIWFNRYKRTLTCNSCGAAHPACLQFHHIDSRNKYSEVGNLVYKVTNIDKLKREIDKCEVLCANCHAKRHWKEIYQNNGNIL